MSRLVALEALRDLLAERLAADEDGKNTASIARQYRDTLREIDDLSRGQRKGSLVDELADRRKARVAGPAGGVGAAGDGRKRGS